MPKTSSNPSMDKSSNAAVSTVTQILRRLGSEIVMTADGEGVSRAEALAGYLWTLALNKEVQLSTGEIVKASNGEWLEIVFRVIERLEGKPMQAISAEVNHGLILNRVPRLGGPQVDSVDETMGELTREPGIVSNAIIDG